MLRELVEVECALELGECKCGKTVDGALGDESGRPHLDIISSSAHFWVSRF